MTTLALLAALALGAAPASPDRSGTYEYLYPEPTETLREDHYVVLTRTAQGFAGRYHGTSDDFDEAREGYLPGYFAVPMDSLEIRGDSIAFVLHLRGSDLLQRPVPPTLAKPAGRAKPWGVSLPPGRRAYRGIFKAGQLILDMPTGPRPFRRRPGP